MKQKRDLDLIRKLLIDLEGVEEVDLSGYEQSEIFYHTYLIQDAGLAEGNVLWDSSKEGNAEPFDAFLTHLTWEGQEFLADARNPQAWNAVKSQIAAKGLMFP